MVDRWRLLTAGGEILGKSPNYEKCPSSSADNPHTTNRKCEEAAPRRLQKVLVLEADAAAYSPIPRRGLPFGDVFRLSPGLATAFS